MWYRKGWCNTMDVSYDKIDMRFRSPTVIEPAFCGFREVLLKENFSKTISTASNLVKRKWKSRKSTVVNLFTVRI